MDSAESQLNAFLNSDTLDDNFFADVVENKLNIPRNEFKVKLIYITPAAGKNDNYISLVLRSRIKVQFLVTNKCELIDVIIKVSLASFEEANELSVFKREQFVYESLIKSFEDLWLQKTGQHIQFAPKTFKFVNSPHEVMVMDDLKALNCVMMDKKEGLNVEQSKLFLAKLAKFHAAGAVCFQKDGPLKDFLDRNCPTAPKPDINCSFTFAFVRIYDEFVKTLRSFGDCDLYLEKIEKWDKFFTGSCYFYESFPMKCGMQVLNHGDVWVNNMMFNFDINDVLMIDFQLCFWGSPAYDILLFLALSVHDDLKAKHFDELLEFYHEEFTGSLRQLDYEHHIPSLEEFNEDIMEKSYIAASFLPLMFFTKYSPKFDFSLEMLMRETDESVLRNIYDDMFSDKLMLQGIRSWLPFMYERGMLDRLIRDK